MTKPTLPCSKDSKSFPSSISFLAPPPVIDADLIRSARDNEFDLDSPHRCISSIKEVSFVSVCCVTRDECRRFCFPDIPFLSQASVRSFASLQRHRNRTDGAGSCPPPELKGDAERQLTPDINFNTVMKTCRCQQLSHRDVRRMANTGPHQRHIDEQTLQ